MSYKFVPSSQVGKRTPSRLVMGRRSIITAIRIVAGCSWLFTSWYTNQTNAIQEITRQVAINPWHAFWLHIAVLNLHNFVACSTLVEGLIGFCLLCGLFNNLANGMATVWALLAWSTHGLFLIPPGSLSGDSGIALVWLLISAGLILSGAGKYYGLDRLLTDKLGRWAFLASGSHTWEVHEIATMQQIPPFVTSSKRQRSQRAVPIQSRTVQTREEMLDRQHLLPM